MYSSFITVCKGAKYLYYHHRSCDEGNIAGPRILEHMVDVCSILRGNDPTNSVSYVLSKNRFGSTSETGIFAMEERGLGELENPSEALLAERSDEESTLAAIDSAPILKPVSPSPAMKVRGSHSLRAIPSHQTPGAQRQRGQQRAQGCAVATSRWAGAGQ